MDNEIKAKPKYRTINGWIHYTFQCAECGNTVFTNFGDMSLGQAKAEMKSIKKVCKTCEKPDRSKRLKSHKLERDNKMVINKGLSPEQEIRILEREFKEKEIKDAEEKKLSMIKKPKKIIGSKFCSKCGIERLLTEFYKNKYSRDKLTCWCKDCLREYNKDYQLRLKEKKEKLEKSQSVD